MAQTATMTLADFLLARIADDEDAARASRREEHTHVRDREDLRVEVGKDTYSRLVVSSGRVLAECQAKRAIVASRATFEKGRNAESEIGMKLTMGGCVAGMDVALKYLAVPYADHADYRNEWRPIE